MKHETDQARAETEQSERSVWWNKRGKSWEGIHVVLLHKLLQKQESQTSMRRILKEDLRTYILPKCRKGMNFQPLMNVLDLTNVNTFWISWQTERCPIWCSLMRRNLRSGRSPLFFVPSGVKLNCQRYISVILEAELLPWAREHFDGAPWTLQQDSAPSHGSKMTQCWI